MRVFVGFSVAVFVLGGLVFGLVFLANLKTLIARGDSAIVNVPVAGEINFSKLPQLAQLPQLPQITLPTLPTSLPQLGPTMLLPEWQGKKPIGILLLGVDKRPQERVEDTRTDTMMLVVIDPQNKGALLLSLPRDLWVPIPGYGEQRVNVAHAVGGPALAKKTIEQDFAVSVDYYARIDFHAFEEMVDTLGGVLVDVERPIKDDEYPTENYGYTRVYIAAGPQLMDGRTALQYVRSRHSESDFGRMQRQQRFLVSLRERALQLNVLPKLPSLIGLLQSSVATDLNPTQMLALARLGSEIDRDRISTLVIDGRYVDPYTGSEGASLLLPRTQAIRSAIRDALTAMEKSDAASVTTIEVLNGTEHAGLAQAAASYLTGQKFSVVGVANADRSDYADSTITVPTGKVKAGQTLAAALKLPASIVHEQEPRPDGTADIRLVLGRTFKLPQ